MLTHRYLNEVGQLYLGLRKTWQQGFEYNFTVYGHELRIFFNHPGQNIIDSVENKRVSVGFLHEPPVIFLLFEIEGLCEISDLPFSYHLVPKDDQYLPALYPLGIKTVFKIILIDALTSVVSAIRILPIPEQISDFMHSALHVQAAETFSEYAYREDLASLYARYPTSLDLWKRSTNQFRSDLA